MKAGLGYLIIGVVLLAAGIVVAGFSAFGVIQQVLQGSTIIDQISLEPNLSFVAVTKGLPAGHELLLSISANPSDTPLQADSSARWNHARIIELDRHSITRAAKTRVSGERM